LTKQLEFHNQTNKTMSYNPSTMPNSNAIQLPYNTNPNTTPTYTSPNPPAYNNPGERDPMSSVKRKRGRPRKYPIDVSLSPDVGPTAQIEAISGSDLGSEKKPRGRPPGSLNKQPSVALGSPGVGFMPHILDVKPREDVIAKMMWFSQNSTRALCVLSANGAVSSVTLRQSATSSRTVTYEGNFEILSLSGSFMVSEVDGQRIRTGGISVSLSGPDGRVLGGNIAGVLTAAGPVQVIVGSFAPSSQKQTKTQVAGNNEAEVVNAPHSESSGGGLGSPFNHSNTNSNPQSMANMTWR
ncbi:hypothetical protein M8C21_006376, partial [Ambrosia artemisiifolia]